MDIRIGITHTPKEIELEIAEETSRETLISQVEAVLNEQEKVLWLLDRKGRLIGVPANKLAYVEIGSEKTDRKVGFSVP